MVCQIKTKESEREEQSVTQKRKTLRKKKTSGLQGKEIGKKQKKKSGRKKKKGKSTNRTCLCVFPIAAHSKNVVGITRCSSAMIFSWNFTATLTSVAQLHRKKPQFIESTKQRTSSCFHVLRHRCSSPEHAVQEQTSFLFLKKFKRG